MFDEPGQLSHSWCAISQLNPTNTRVGGMKKLLVPSTSTATQRRISQGRLAREAGGPRLSIDCKPRHSFIACHRNIAFLAAIRCARTSQEAWRWPAYSHTLSCEPAPQAAC